MGNCQPSMRTSFLFLAAFIAVAAAQASSTPNVEPGLSGGLRMEFEAAMNQSNALMMALPDPFANWHKPLPDGPHVTTCSDLPVLQNTCLGVYLQASDLSLSVWLSIKGASAFGHKVFAANISMTKVSAGKFCLKDTDLLELIELIPVLLPFKIPIDKIIKELGTSQFTSSVCVLNLPTIKSIHRKRPGLLTQRSSTISCVSVAIACAARSARSTLGTTPFIINQICQHAGDRPFTRCGYTHL